MAQGSARIASRRTHWTEARREDHDLSLFHDECFTARLCPRPVLNQEKLAAFVLDAGATEEAGHLQREHELAIEILMERIPSPGAVRQHQRRRLGLTGKVTLLEVCFQRRRKRCPFP